MHAAGGGQAEHGAAFTGPCVELQVMQPQHYSDPVYKLCQVLCKVPSWLGSTCPASVAGKVFGVSGRRQLLHHTQRGTGPGPPP